MNKQVEMGCMICCYTMYPEFAMLHNHCFCIWSVVSVSPSIYLT